MLVLGFDTETTGLNGYVIELSAVLVKYDEENHKARVITALSTALNPLLPVEREVERKFKVQSWKLKNFPFFISVLSPLFGLFREADLVVGHNVSFDLKILSNELKRIGRDLSVKDYKRLNFFCTCLDTEFLFPKRPKLEELVSCLSIPQKTLQKLYSRVNEITNYSPEVIRKEKTLYHNAVYDSLASLCAFLYLYRMDSRIRARVRERMLNPSLAFKGKKNPY